MEDVGVRELRQNLSVWLRRVQDGEAFRVTDRGRPVALLSALPTGDGLADLAAAGVVSLPTGHPAAPLAPLDGLPPASEALRAMRDEDDR